MSWTWEEAASKKKKEKPHATEVEENEGFNGIPRLGNWEVASGLLP